MAEVGVGFKGITRLNSFGLYDRFLVTVVMGFLILVLRPTKTTPLAKPEQYGFRKLRRAHGPVHTTVI
jgi:hypothetical protein